MKGLDIAGLLLLVLFAGFVWPPLSLFALGVSCLFISRGVAMSRKAPSDGETK